jgi:hypothetical protein
MNKKMSLTKRWSKAEPLFVSEQRTLRRAMVGDDRGWQHRSTDSRIHGTLPFKTGQRPGADSSLKGQVGRWG